LQLGIEPAAVELQCSHRLRGVAIEALGQRQQSRIAFASHLLDQAAHLIGVEQILLHLEAEPAVELLHEVGGAAVDPGDQRRVRHG